MPTNNKCAFKGCNHTTKNPEGYTFHRFPKDPKLQVDWILLSGNDNFVDLTPKQIYEKRLCSAHFHQTDFQQTSKSKRKLNNNVMPIAYEERIDSISAEKTSNINNENLNIENISGISESIENTQKENEHDLSIGAGHSQPTSVEDKRKVMTIVNFKRTILDKHKRRDKPKHILSNKIAQLRAKVKAQDSKIRRLQIASKKMKRKLDPDSLTHYAARYLNDEQLMFLQMQLNHSKKQPWTEQEKDFALSLYFTSPKAYSLLKDERKFALPCITLIRQWSSNLSL